jgi:prevent-host-death family protein
MKDKVISVMDASRNFADCLNPAYYQGAIFLVTKNGVPVARIGPAREKTCTAKKLAEALKEIGLTKVELKAFANDLRSNSQSLRAPEEKWELSSTLRL